MAGCINGPGGRARESESRKRIGGTGWLGLGAPWMSGAQFGDPKELRPVALGEAPFGIRLYDSRPDGRPPVSEKMLHQAPWMSGAQFGDPKELRPVALGEAPFGIRLYDSRPDGRPPVSEKMLHQAPWMSGAQFGDPKELRPVALGEAPFGIRLYDSRPDGRPPVSEKMLHQTMKGLDFSACQIGSDRRCATRTGHGEPVGPDHSLEFRRHKSRCCGVSGTEGLLCGFLFSAPGNKCAQSGDS
ncbi:uncharacterized protein [Nerophis lumbriciformis]|uniref:uncharacterized protein isoform X6 n=1 Tax=Nerophis lumbriciformis TaxID=546530 RepID=UPI003BAC9290